MSDPDKRSELLRLVGLGGPSGTIANAAKAVGTSSSAVHRYAKGDDAFRADLAAARRRASVVAHHAPRMLPATANPPPGAHCPPTGDPVDIATGDSDPCSEAGRGRLYRLLWQHAEDPASKGCPKSLDVLAQIAFAPELIAMQAKAKREALEAGQAGQDRKRPVVIRVPVKSPGSAVIEAEVVDPRETRH